MIQFSYNQNFIEMTMLAIKSNASNYKKLVHVLKYFTMQSSFWLFPILSFITCSYSKMLSRTGWISLLMLINFNLTISKNCICRFFKGNNKVAVKTPINVCGYFELLQHVIFVCITCIYHLSSWILAFKYFLHCYIPHLRYRILMNGW